MLGMTRLSYANGHTILKTPRSITELKQYRVCLVLGLVTAWEYHVPLASSYLYLALAVFLSFLILSSFLVYGDKKKEIFYSLFPLSRYILMKLALPFTRDIQAIYCLVVLPHVRQRAHRDCWITRPSLIDCKIRCGAGRTPSR